MQVSFKWQVCLGKNKKIPYYEHCWSTKRNSNIGKKIFDCGNHRRFSGKKLEEVVIEKTLKLMTDPSFASRLLKKVRAKRSKKPEYQVEIERLKNTVYSYNSQIDALAERLASLPLSVNATPIYKQIERLEGLKKESSDKILQLEKKGVIEVSGPIELESYQAFLKGLREVFTDKAPELVKKRVLHKLIHRIDVGNDFVKIHFNIDNLSLREPTNVGSLFLFEDAKVIPLAQDKKNPSIGITDPGNQKKCSNSLTIGSGGGT